MSLALTWTKNESYPLPVNLLPRDYIQVIRDSPRKSEEESQDVSEPVGLGPTDDI